MRCFTLNLNNMANEFKPNVGGQVSKKEAMEWIEKYDKEMRKDKAADTRSMFYGRDMLLKILSQEGCTGITFFFALKHSEHFKKETLQLILVPTREDGTHIWPDDETRLASGDAAGAYDIGLGCPPYCG